MICDLATFIFQTPILSTLTHWGRVTHICVGNLTIIGSDNGLSPGWRQAITWTNVGILLIGRLGTNISEMLIEIHTFSFKKIHLKMSSGKWRPFCLGLNVLKHCGYKLVIHLNVDTNSHELCVAVMNARRAKYFAKLEHIQFSLSGSLDIPYPVWKSWLALINSISLLGSSLVCVVSLVCSVHVCDVIHHINIIVLEKGNYNWWNVIITWSIQQPY